MVRMELSGPIVYRKSRFSTEGFEDFDSSYGRSHPGPELSSTCTRRIS